MKYPLDMKYAVAYCGINFISFSQSENFISEAYFILQRNISLGVRYIRNGQHSLFYNKFDIKIRKPHTVYPAFLLIGRTRIVF